MKYLEMDYTEPKQYSKLEKYTGPVDFYHNGGSLG